MKIAFWGWNGNKNVGDDAMTQAMVEGLIRNYKIQEFLFWDCNVNNNSMEYLNEYKSDYKIKDFDFSRFKKYLVLHCIYALLINPIYLIFNYDLIIIGGGSIFHTFKSNFIYYNLLVLRKIFLIKRLKIVSIGVSAGPFNSQSAEDMFFKIAKKLDFLSVRDLRSFQLCREKNIKNINYSPDLAITLPFFKKIIPAKKNKINIILRQGYITDEVRKILIKAVIHIQDNYPNTDIVLLSACELDTISENDSIAITEFIRYLPEDRKRKIFVKKYNSIPLDFFEFIGEAILNISIRLHGIIISYAMDTPFICISYHQKCLDFFNDMNIPKQYLFQEDRIKDDDKIKHAIDGIFKEEKITFQQKNNSLGHFNELKNVISIN